MSAPIKQHLIDPEICIRCYTCEMTCPIEAITHDDNNVVVDADICNGCMDCIPVCPTGSIDEWRVVNTPYTLDEQFEFDELPEQEDIEVAATADEEDPIAALLAGCTIVLKPAPDTPLMGSIMGELAGEAGIPPGVLNVITSADPAMAGEMLVGDPRVDVISFTRP